MCKGESFRRGKCVNARERERERERGREGEREGEREGGRDVISFIFKRS